MRPDGDRVELFFGGGAEAWRGAAVAGELRPIVVARGLVEKRSDLSRHSVRSADQEKIPNRHSQQDSLVHQASLTAAAQAQKLRNDGPESVAMRCVTNCYTSYGRELSSRSQIEAP